MGERNGRPGNRGGWPDGVPLPRALLAGDNRGAHHPVRRRRAGHIYYWVVENNTNPYNIGVPLWTDILLPIVMWALYAWSWHSNGDAVPKGQP